MTNISKINKQIVLIACSSRKLNFRAKTKDMYTSSLFCKSLRYAESLQPDCIFILSAKYGLLQLEEEIDSYNITLNKMPDKARQEWARAVIDKLKRFASIDNDEFIFLAGVKYRKYLLPYISNYKIPLEGLGIGKQLKYLTDITNDKFL